MVIERKFGHQGRFRRRCAHETKLSETGQVREATAIDLGSTAYGRVRVEQYLGYPATLLREIVFLKAGGVIVKDTLTVDIDLQSRWSPSYRVRNVGPDHGPNWINSFVGPWVPLRGLGRNASVYTRWRNNPRDLLLYFLPEPHGRLELVDERANDPTLPLPLRVQYTMRDALRAGVPVSAVTLLIPHPPGSAVLLADGVQVRVNDPHRTVVEFPDATGTRNLLTLNASGRRLEAGNLTTDAQVACLRLRDGEICSVAMFGGTELVYEGRSLADQAPTPAMNHVPASLAAARRPSGEPQKSE